MAEYIERQAVLDEMDEDIEEFVECDYALKTAKKYIKKLPPADVRPVVRGRWVRNNGKWCCDKCTCPVQVIRSPFCPNCGANMHQDKEVESDA